MAAPRYTADSRDRVRDAVDMVALVSARTELRRAGADSYFGLCPFHDERTPSFHVRPDEKHYHCFGCQASGDPFTFVMETEGLDFRGALEALANRFGVQLQTEDEDPATASRRERRQRLHELLGRAAAYYARFLAESPEAAPAREYLRRRGFADETLSAFRVGYAPSAWDRILTASRRAGFTEEELLAVGLAQRSKAAQGRIYDRFRERIMFPAADGRGRVLGFGARAMRENQLPKYLNTSDGELYHKRSVLFGLDLARAAAAKAARMILVEGYTDVLALHQAGLTNVVAIMGTSLTEEQVSELERVVGPDGVLELCLDADRAGQQAMLRAAQLAEGRRLKLRVVPLPEGMDPAELIQREGDEQLRQRVSASVPFVVFHVERILDRADPSDAEGRDRAIADLTPALKLDAYSGALREELPRRISNRLGLSEGRLAALLQASGSTLTTSGNTRMPAPAVTDPAVRTERAFLVLCVALPEAGRRALQAIDPDQHLTSERLRRAARHLAGQTEMPLSGLAPDDEVLTRVMADLVARAGRAGKVTPEQLEQQRLLLERARLERAIRRAREEGGLRVGELAREREQVLGEIRAIDARMEKAL
ncbi:MAG TPA: DNA primase [Solirubrobacteraceae bacterium]|nr:DNA primase [Solirubrobacteraceae bacterium]